MVSNWRVQLGVGANGDLWEAVDLLLERMKGKVEVNWVRGHEDKRTTRMMMSKHKRGSGARSGCCCPGGSLGGCVMTEWRWWGCSGRS